MPSYSPSYEGKALNLSARRLYFTAREKLSFGAPLEIYLTIPRELTGRGPEPVRCRARVVRVDEIYPQQGVKGVGAIVDRYETVAMSRNWGDWRLKVQIMARMGLSLVRGGPMPVRARVAACRAVQR
ncbi:MAG: hypothetical protein WA581_07720 [Candidatus Acidiferrales bacterium]